jgi:hypothetical protein
MKVGRNDPCLCGSGRKYKKCCLSSGEAVAPGHFGEPSAIFPRAEINAPFEAAFESEPDPIFPFAPEDGPLHAWALILAKRMPGAEPSPEETRNARALASPIDVIDTIVGIHAARMLEWEGLGQAYELLAVILMETLERRSAVGIQAAGIEGGRDPLDDVAAMIEHEITERGAPRKARDIFRSLRRRVRLAPTSRAGGDADLDRVLALIQGLREKTVDRGCTEEEALAAAEKVAELLDRYGLSLSEVDLKGQACEGFGVDTGRKRFGPMDSCIPAVAMFCDCRAWSEKTDGGEIRYLFFGLPADVAGARYLYEMVESAFVTETERFRRGELYADHHSRQRRSATTSFQTGFADGIATKIRNLHEARQVAMVTSTGRDLVPLKAAVIDDEMEKLGLDLKARNAGRGKRVLSDAYLAGHAAGARFEWRPGIEERVGN